MNSENIKNRENQKNTKNQAKEVETDVLYQKLGDQWYAFSVINDEVFMSPVSEEAVRKIRQDTGIDA